MKLKPLTNDHPQELLNSDNARAHQVGSLGNNPSDWISGCNARNPPEYERGYSDSDGFHVSIDMTINDAETIREVLAGKTALSMGYECDFEPAAEGAVWCGTAYDGVQRNIRYNHCAIVDAARAGDAARIRMDGATAVRAPAEIKTNKETKPEKEKSRMKKIRVDGVEYEGDDGLVMQFVEQQKCLKEAEKCGKETKKQFEDAKKELAEEKAKHAEALSALCAERDTQKDRADKAEAELKELKEKELDPKRIDEAVNARIALLDAAARADVEVKDGASELDIKKAVISAVYPNAKLDDKDGAYISAHYDGALEALDAQTDAAGREAPAPVKERGDARADSAAAHKRMVERLKAQSRGEEAKL
jgi:hypothetical protein